MKTVITPHGTLTAIMVILSSIIPENGYAHSWYAHTRDEGPSHDEED